MSPRSPTPTDKIKFLGNDANSRLTPRIRREDGKHQRKRRRRRRRNLKTHRGSIRRFCIQNPANNFNFLMVSPLVDTVCAHRQLRFVFGLFHRFFGLFRFVSPVFASISTFCNTDSGASAPISKLEKRYLNQKKEQRRR